MKEKYDAVIVGGGIGGLLAGGMLAKEGLEILIVEKNSFLGGRSRTIEWNGFRADMYPKVHCPHFNKFEDTWLVKALAMLGLTLDESIINWKIAAINKKGQTKPEFHSFDPSIGSDAFVNFFTLMTGAKFNEKQETELKRVLGEMNSLSEETCEEFMNISLNDWCKENVADAVVRNFFVGTAILSGLDITDYAVGWVMRTMGTIYSKNFTFGYLNGKLQMDAIVTPLEKACEQLGCDILKGISVRKVCVDNKRIDGVWIEDNNTLMTYKVDAPMVVCDVPLFQAMGTIFDDNDFTEGERNYITALEKGKQCDWLGWYFLKEEVIPPDFPAWANIFDYTKGGPMYIGDLYIPLRADPWLGATGPKGKQMVQLYMVGGKAGHFGSDHPSFNKVREKELRLEAAMETMIPGFTKAIEHQTRVFAGAESGHYWFHMHDPKCTVEVKSKAVDGLYFVGDTPLVLGCMLGVERCGRIAIECRDAILRDRGKS
jgi:phytoene dehydrogenase-like protein